MKHIKKLIPFLAFAALALAACSGGGGNNQGTPAASGVPNTGGTAVTTSVPSTGATSALPTVEATTGTSVALPTTAATTGVSSTAAATPAVPATASVGTPAVMNTETSLSTMVATSGVTPVASGGTPSTSAVSPIIPSTGSGRGQLVSLAAMMKYRVIDNTGAIIGTVSDYVVNVCEAHIVYAVVAPDSSLNIQGGKQLLIPYEAFFETPNSGKIDAGTGVLTLNVAASSLSTAPSVDVTTLDMQNPTWDANIMAYWRQTFRLSLTTGCRIPAPGAAGTPNVSGTAVPYGSSVLLGTVVPTGSTAGAGTAQPGVSGTSTAGFAPTYEVTKTANRQEIFRIGLASQILGAPLQEYNGNSIGQDRDIAIIVQTGGIIYYVVEATPGTGVQGTTGTVAAPSLNTGVQGTSVSTMSTGTPGAQVTSVPNTGASGNAGQTMTTGRLIALPPAAVNIRYQNNASGQNAPVLVLLAQANVFLQAPAFNAQTGTNTSDWFNYWQKYVPMTQSEVP